MTDDVKALLTRFRSRLAGRVAGLRDSANCIKAGDIVDDDACDAVTTAAQDIATTFNELGLEPVEVPDDNEPSPYQPV